MGPDHTWYEIFLPQPAGRPFDSTFYDAKTWCEERFGKQWDVRNKQDGVWQAVYARDYVQNSSLRFRFIFYNSQDAVLFALRWS